MLITLHDMKNNAKVGVDIRNISYFAENKGIIEGKPHGGTALFINNQLPFLVSESFDQVRELVELAGKKR